MVIISVAFAASLLAFILCGGYSMVTYRYNVNYQYMNMDYYEIMQRSASAIGISSLGLIYTIFIAIPVGIGWYLLGTVCLGVGILFVNPYFQATRAELYIFLRDRAIQTNQVHPAELGLLCAVPNTDAQIPPVL
jgi:hypothetical protein